MPPSRHSRHRRLHIATGSARGTYLPWLAWRCSPVRVNPAHRARRCSSRLPEHPSTRVRTGLIGHLRLASDRPAQNESKSAGRGVAKPIFVGATAHRYSPLLRPVFPPVKPLGLPRPGAGPVGDAVSQAPSRGHPSRASPPAHCYIDHLRPFARDFDLVFTRGEIELAFFQHIRVIAADGPLDSYRLAGSGPGCVTVQPTVSPML